MARKAYHCVFSAATALMGALRIEHVSGSRHLSAVKALGRANRRTLGLFPDGAFDEYAQRGTILIAVDEQTGCAGYLLYRLSKQRAVIVHLCVDKRHHQRGVARKLVERLVEVTRTTRGISLKCRRDFPANSLWPKLGFTILTEVPGRGKPGKPLVCWWRNQRDATLFSEAASRLQESKLSAVIDANVLFDMREKPTAKTIPAQSLRADWLQGLLELFVTDEVFTEINRNPDPASRRRSTTIANEFHCLPCDSDEFDEMCRELRAIFPQRMTEQDESDLRQLARAIAAEASYFITRDRHLLHIAEQVEAVHGTLILHPTDLIVRLDELRRREEYQPVRFVGTTLAFRRCTSNDTEALADRLRDAKGGEKRGDFLRRTRRFLAEPEQYTCQAVFDAAGAPLALIVAGCVPESPDELAFPVLRVAAGRLAETVARQMIRQCVLTTLSRGLLLTHITEDHLDEALIRALYDSGFFEVMDGWIKVSLPVAEPAASIAQRIEALADHDFIEPLGLEEWARLVRDQATDPWAASLNEHDLWPAKITDADIPSYIVPVQPRWARELFDEGLASQELFGRKQELALRTEMVYYRSPAGPAVTAPGRILWYVSAERGTRDTKCLRACSRLDEVEKGLPKQLFRKNRRLGTYEWKHVYDMVKGNVNRPIMTLRFSDTELFATPIRWSRMQKVLEGAGIRTQLRTLVKIPKDVFVGLYRRGTTRKER